MIKTVEDRVWAFDLEWVPDPLAGRLLLDLVDRASPVPCAAPEDLNAEIRDDLCAFADLWADSRESTEDRGEGDSRIGAEI